MQINNGNLIRNIHRTDTEEFEWTNREMNHCCSSVWSRRIMTWYPTRLDMITRELPPTNFSNKNINEKFSSKACKLTPQCTNILR